MKSYEKFKKRRENAYHHPIKSSELVGDIIIHHGSFLSSVILMSSTPLEIVACVVTHNVRFD